jgi:hypothetical protein
VVKDFAARRRNGEYYKYINRNTNIYFVVFKSNDKREYLLVSGDEPEYWAVSTLLFW